MMDAKLLLSKFRGSMLGSLIGDCCGAPFEGQLMDSGAKLILKSNLDRLEGPYFKAPYKKYTDDTAMTKCLSRALLDPNGFSQKTFAKNLVIEYFKEPKRGYGAAVGEVFTKLRKAKIADPIGPASQQFGGMGSYGNGAAMRVMPIALYCTFKENEIRKYATDSALVTHSHKLAIHGAVLQALAVHQSLVSDPNVAFNNTIFLDNLLRKMKEIEAENDPELEDNCRAYENQLNAIFNLLSQPEAASDDQVLNVLGHSVAAMYSVPTAVYCFLRCTNGTMADAQKSFRDTLEYAISLGGDTDTIASMACAISGAYHGDSAISPNLIKHCEDHEVITEMADDMFHLWGTAS